MKLLPISSYILNCFLLLIPILAWNAILGSKLPVAYQAETFDKDIPSAVPLGENIFRSLVMFLPLLMPLSFASRSQKFGLYIFIFGMLIYFLSWTVLIVFPSSTWSMSAAGFLAPAYTPLIWLVGIGLIGTQFYFKSPYQSWMYILLSVIFLSFHIKHAAIVYLRLNS
jgi:hypothetical protein